MASLGGLDGHLGQERDLVVRALGQDRAHDLGVEDPGLVASTKRDLMPEAFSMNSGEEGAAAVTSPAAMASALAALKRST